MKGILQPDHIPVNKFKLLVLGGPPEIVFTNISGIEETTTSVVLPDKTVASGGLKEPVEFTAMHPLHHSVHHAFLESWFREGQDPVSPTYKKTGTLMLISGSGAIIRSWALSGAWVDKRTLPELAMDDDGEMAQAEWGFRADQLLLIS